MQAPYFSYQTREGGLLTPGEDCENEHVVGLRHRVRLGESNYPAAYKGAMFFSDYARSCMWVLGKKPNGDPDPAAIQPFVQDAETPVDLVAGPGGDLYYVDYGLDDGRCRRERRRRPPHRLHGQQRRADRAHHRQPDVRDRRR